MKKLAFSLSLIATVLASYVYAQTGYPLGSDVASTITTSKFHVDGVGAALDDLAEHAVGSTWDTKRPTLYKGAISAILDSSTASLTSAVTVIEGTRQSF